MAEETKSKVGPVSILVNNAGIVSGTSLLDTSDEKIIRTFDVNIMAHFWTIKAFLPDMISNKQVRVYKMQNIFTLISRRASIISTQCQYIICLLLGSPGQCRQPGGSQRHQQAGRLLRLQVRGGGAGRVAAGGAVRAGPRRHRQDHRHLPLLHQHRHVCRGPGGSLHTVTKNITLFISLVRAR